MSKCLYKKTHPELYFYFISTVVLSFTAVDIQCQACSWVGHQKCRHTIWSVGLTAVYEQQVAMFRCTAIAYFSCMSWKTGQTEVAKGKKLCSRKENYFWFICAGDRLQAIRYTRTVVFMQCIHTIIYFPIMLCLISAYIRSGAIFYSLRAWLLLFHEDGSAQPDNKSPGHVLPAHMMARYYIVPRISLCLRSVAGLCPPSFLRWNGVIRRRPSDCPADIRNYVWNRLWYNLSSCMRRRNPVSVSGAWRMRWTHNLPFCLARRRTTGCSSLLELKGDSITVIAGRTLVCRRKFSALKLLS